MLGWYRPRLMASPAMSSSVPRQHRSYAFNIETERGIRHLEFDPDIVRSHDVRILVDGTRVAELPFPKPASPYHEVPFELDGHSLVGVTWLPRESWEMGSPLAYDVFADGRSLTDGTSLAETRQHAPSPGAAYPRSFYILDMVFRTAPAAATSGLIVGVARTSDELGLQRTIGLIGLIIVSLGLATAVGSRIWQRIRSADGHSVRHRSGLGWVTVLISYAVSVIAVLVAWAIARS